MTYEFTVYMIYQTGEKSMFVWIEKQGGHCRFLVFGSTHSNGQYWSACCSMAMVMANGQQALSYDGRRQAILAFGCLRRYMNSRGANQNRRLFANANPAACPFWGLSVGILVILAYKVVKRLLADWLSIAPARHWTAQEQEQERE